MPNVMTLWNKVDKSGDVMSGDLNLGMNSLILNDGVHGGRLRGNPTLANEIMAYNIANSDYGVLRCSCLWASAFLQSVLGQILFGNSTDGAIFESKTGQGQKLFVRNFADSLDALIAAGGAAFSDHVTLAATKLVDGRDVSEIKQAKVKVGSYTGDNNDNRNINIGIDLTAKANVSVFITNRYDGSFVRRTELAQGDLTTRTTGAAMADLIQTLTATGFQIGADNNVNRASQVFEYVVVYEEP